MGKLNLNAVQQKNEELRQGGGNNYGFDKLETGKNIRRILPPKGAREIFWSEGFMHYSLGADGKTAVTCLSTFNKRCPICDYLDSIQGSKNKDDQEMIKNCKKTKKIFVSVLNRDSQDEEEKPLVLGIGKSILQGITDAICDPDYGDITDFETGRDITITKSGSGLNTSYSVLPKPKESIASESYSEEELDELIPDLDSLFVEKSVEELEAILRGETYNEEDESGDEEELDYDEMNLDDLKYLCKDRGIKVPAGAKRNKLVQLLIEYDEAADDEEDEEEPPRRKGGRGAVNPPEEDESDDEEDSGEDDDENDDLIRSVRKNIRNKAGKK